MSRFFDWITMTHTARYHAHYQTVGEGHVYQGRYKSFPIDDDIHFLIACRYVERNALAAKEEKHFKQSLERGCPFGNELWVQSTIECLGLKSTQRSGGRPRKLS